MDALIHFLRDTPVWILALCFVAENVFILGATVLVGEMLVRLYSAHRVTEVAPPLSSTEVLLACTTVTLNSLVTLAGLLLWRGGFIHFRSEMGWAVVLDFVVLVLVMDAAM